MRLAYAQTTLQGGVQHDVQIQPGDVFSVNGQVAAAQITNGEEAYVVKACTNPIGVVVATTNRQSDISGGRTYQEPLFAAQLLDDLMRLNGISAFAPRGYTGYPTQQQAQAASNLNYSNWTIAKHLMPDAEADALDICAQMFMRGLPQYSNATAFNASVQRARTCTGKVYNDPRFQNNDGVIQLHRPPPVGIPACPLSAPPPWARDDTPRTPGPSATRSSPPYYYCGDQSGKPVPIRGRGGFAYCFSQDSYGRRSRPVRCPENDFICTSGPPPQRGRTLTTQDVCTTCDCAQGGGGPESVNAYARGFVQGFASCLGGTVQGPLGTISSLVDDSGQLAAIGQALVHGDVNTAAGLLIIKGERNRAEFDGFIKSLVATLNPKIIGATPEQAGIRDGFRLCAFGVVPAVSKAIVGKMLPGGAVLPKSGILMRQMRLEGSSALLNRNNINGVGLAFEYTQGGNLPTNYPVIDAIPANELMSAVYDNGALVQSPSEITSMKTLGAMPGSYSAGTAVLSTVRTYLNGLYNYTSACRNGIRIVAGPNTRRIMKLGIPPTATAEQLAQIDEAALYARQLGIDFRVYQLHGVEGW